MRTPARLLLALALVAAVLPLTALSAVAAAILPVDQADPGCDDVAGLPYCTIGAAVAAASAGDTVSVAAGTYVENVAIGQDLTLAGTGMPTIQGISSAGALGTVVVTGPTSGVTIDGFTIIGIDNGFPGVENAAVYLRGAQDGTVITDNEIVAAGDEGLLGEYGASLTNLVVDGNTFSGQTFVGPTPGGLGFGTQFTTPNVPRQLVVLGGGAGNDSITFSNNQVVGTAGGLNGSGDEQGNTLVTIDAANSAITGNTFAGTTTRFATSLRARRAGTVISGNTFSSAGLGDLVGHVYVQFSGQTLADIAAANAFDRGVYIDTTVGTIGHKIEPFAEGAPTGAVIDVLPGTYVEGTPQIDIDTDITLQGAGSGVTIVNAGASTTSSGDGRGWFLVRPGADVHLSGMTLDGAGNSIWQAVRHRGTGSFTDVAFRNIRWSAPSAYAGTAIAAFGGSGPVDVTGSSFENIGRIGVLYFGAGQTGAFTGNTYTGKGVGDHLDYALDISAGAVIDVTGNTITGNRGVASSDGSTSAGILATTFFGGGTTAALTGNTITDSTSAVAVGYAAGDTSAVTLIGNDLSGNDLGLNQVAGTTLLEGNDLTGNADGGISVTDGGITDAGQGGGGTDFTGLGISAGGNDLSSYLPGGSPAIRNANTNPPNDAAGPQGAPHDLTAVGNLFFSFAASSIEDVILHDVDDPARGFVDASDPVVGGDPRPRIRDTAQVLRDLLPTGDDKDDKRIEKAIEKLEKADDDDNWTDDVTPSDEDGDKVFKEVEKALKELSKVDGALPEVDLVTAILVDCARAMAVDAIDAAIAGSGDPKKIEKAQERLADGDQELLDTPDKPDKAVHDYRHAWEEARKAL